MGVFVNVFEKSAYEVVGSEFSECRRTHTHITHTNTHFSNIRCTGGRDPPLAQCGL